MSNSNEGKTTGNWASPPTTTTAQGRPLTGRVIFGLLTGEGPDPTTSADNRGTKATRR